MAFSSPSFADRTSRFPYRLRVENHRRAFVGIRRSLSLRAGPHRLRPAPAGRRDALPQLRAAGCPPPDAPAASAASISPSGHPTPQRVSVIGNFNHWDGRRHPMGNRGATGIWELFIPDLCQGEVYKYEVKSRHDGYLVQKSDPYGFAAELRPKTASVVWDVTQFSWNDQEWIADRGRAAGPRPADRGLRGSPRLLEARRRGRQSRSSTTASWPTSSSRTSTTPTSRTSS